MKRNCGNCQFRDAYCGVCVNFKSEFFPKYVTTTNCCESWVEWDTNTVQGTSNSSKTIEETLKGGTEHE